jgi:hypothetical protein
MVFGLGIAEQECRQCWEARMTQVSVPTADGAAVPGSRSGAVSKLGAVTGLHSKPALESNPRWQRGEPW